MQSGLRTCVGMTSAIRRARYRGSESLHARKMKRVGVLNISGKHRQTHPLQLTGLANWPQIEWSLKVSLTLESIFIYTLFNRYEDEMKCWEYVLHLRYQMSFIAKP